MKKTRIIIALSLLAGLFAVPLHALSPFTTQPIIVAPVQSTALNCVNIAVSTSATSAQNATTVLAANLTREALYVINVSTIPVGGKTVASEVIITSSPVLSQTFASGQMAGIYLTPHTWTDSTLTEENTNLTAIGASVYQGAVYAVAEATGAVISACEFNP